MFQELSCFLGLPESAPGSHQCHGSFRPNISNHDPTRPFPRTTASILQQRRDISKTQSIKVCSQPSCWGPFRTRTFLFSVYASTYKCRIPHIGWAGSEIPCRISLWRCKSGSVWNCFKRALNSKRLKGLVEKNSMSQSKGVQLQVQS